MKAANEKVAPTQHEFVPHPTAADASVQTGYVEKPYEFQEYPKHVDGVLVNSAEEEAAQLAKSAPAEEAANDDDVTENEAAK